MSIESYKPYLPVYVRSPNKLIKYEERFFNDKRGHSGIVNVAIFKDKNGNIQEMDAHVKWTKEVWNLDTQRFVKLKSWMRYCPSIVIDRKNKTEDFWNNLKEAEGINIPKK